MVELASEDKPTPQIRLSANASYGPLRGGSFGAPTEDARPISRSTPAPSSGQTAWASAASSDPVLRVPALSSAIAQRIKKRGPSQRFPVGVKSAPLCDQLSDLTELRVLDIAYNFISSIPAISFLKWGKLQCLYLENNDLESLPTEIKGLTRLQELYLQNNILDALPLEMGLLKELKVLNVRNNKLVHLPKQLGALSLETLELDLQNGFLRLADISHNHASSLQLI